MTSRSRAAAGLRAVDVRPHLQQRGLSDKTVKLYSAELFRIEQGLAEMGFTLNNVTPDALAKYLRTRPKSWSTLKMIRNSLKHFWEISGRKDPPLWAVRIPRKPRMRCRALDAEEAKRLAHVARQHGGREGLAVLFGLYAGIRREEIANVRWSDISHDGWLRVYGKGGTDAQIPLHPALIHALGKMPHDSPWVFPGQTKGSPVTPTTVWTWVARVGAQAGLERLAPHVLRHTCLATANDNTGDLRAVQELARHARPDTTAGYTRATSERMQAAVASLNY